MTHPATKLLPIMSVMKTVTADNYIHAENNWWGSSRGPGQAGGADASDRVDTSPWIIIPQLGAGELFVTDVAEAFTLSPIRITGL